MKKIYIIAMFAILSGCDLFDPTDVDNPSVSEDKFLSDIPRISTSWVNGLERQLATTLNQTVVLGEILSDNYFNNRTLSSKVFDIPDITFQDVDVLSMQSAIHRLRFMAQYGLEQVAPNDDATTDTQRGQMHFYLGLAYLMGGEYFTNLPVSDGGEIKSAMELFQLAIDEFNQAAQLVSAGDLTLDARLGQLRAHYRLGDTQNSLSIANEIIAADPDYVRFVSYEENTRNDMQFFLFDSEANEFAPLPRLDFLDPKYFFEEQAENEQKSVALLKSEEAYLIKAEAELAANQVTQAKATLTALLNDVIAERPTATFKDPDNRNGGTNTSVGIDNYPLSENYMVRFDANSAPIDGLVLNRAGSEVTVPTVSGTHITVADIEAASDSDALLELLYLVRQEVFIAEGRRVVDLGIKLPIAQNEFDGNDQVNDTHIEPQVPDFISSLDAYALDDFENDENNQIITINVNLNSILVANKSSDLVLPFH